MKKSNLLLVLSFTALLLAGCGSSSYQKREKKYPECSANLISMMQQSAECRLMEDNDERRDACRPSLEEKSEFLRNNCEKFMEKANPGKIIKKCSANHKEDEKYTLEEEIQEINCLFEKIGHPEVKITLPEKEISGEIAEEGDSETIH